MKCGARGPAEHGSQTVSNANHFPVELEPHDHLIMCVRACASRQYFIAGVPSGDQTELDRPATALHWAVDITILFLIATSLYMTATESSNLYPPRYTAWTPTHYSNALGNSIDVIKQMTPATLEGHARR